MNMPCDNLQQEDILCLDIIDPDYEENVQRESMHIALGPTYIAWRCVRLPSFICWWCQKLHHSNFIIVPIALIQLDQ